MSVRMQMDMSRYKNAEAVIQDHKDKVQYDMDALKRERDEVKVKATRTWHELQKVCACHYCIFETDKSTYY